ncbi:hypothetical protein [Variovorax boronicumulans]|uniref:hypothetical protein n=1 Tax=Variovorax boronicumulans TaxID=436515 RepID=UPI001C584F02
MPSTTTTKKPALPKAALHANEPATRFCPGCGSVGEVPDTFRDCCPDGARARVIPAALANHCRELFKLALGAASAQPQANAADLWYLQDTRQFVGNDVLWWAKDGKGYTTDLSKAHVFGAAEAARQEAARGVDRAWPKAYIDAKARPAVDFQHINHVDAIAAQAPGARGQA